MQCTLMLFYTAQKQVVQYSFVPLHTTPSFGQTSFNFHSPSSQSFNAISLPLQFTLVSHPIVEILKVLESGVPPVMCRDIRVKDLMEYIVRRGGALMLTLKS